MTDALARVGQLEREDRLEEAAALADASGYSARAADLWERACAFDRAATSAMASGDFARAFSLADRARKDELRASALSKLVAEPELARRAARRFVALGDLRGGALVFEAVGETAEAARCFERSHDFIRAAELFVAAEDTAGAARCLEAAVLARPDDDRARVRLAEILVPDDPEAAARLAQAVRHDSSEAEPAERVLARALDALGFSTTRAQRVAGPEGRRARSEQVLFGRYRVIRQAGGGASASVYEADDRLTGRKVAVKLFRADGARGFGRDALERFGREATALKELRHPAIVPLVDYLPEAPALVLEWMPGGSLADLFERAHGSVHPDGSDVWLSPSVSSRSPVRAGETRGRHRRSAGLVAPARAAEIVLVVLTALHEAHRRGILHRDVKPSNVLFDGAGLAHLSDFGSAHLESARATVTEGPIGSLAYMAPEQRAGAPASPASDVYGAGAILWEALTGATPDAHRPFLSPVLGGVHRAIAAALIAPANERPESAEDAMRLIRSAAWPDVAPAPSGSETSPERKSARARYSASGPSIERDAVLDRDVRVVPATGSALDVARSFARAAHPALATIYEFDEASGVVRVETAPSISDSEALTDAELAVLLSALRALHRAGAAHGAVGREHVFRRGGSVALRYPHEPGAHAAPSDLEALARLQK